MILQPAFPYLVLPLTAVRTRNVQRLCQDKLRSAISLLSMMRNAPQRGGREAFGKLEVLKKFVRYRLGFLAGSTAETVKCLNKAIRRDSRSKSQGEVVCGALQSGALDEQPTEMFICSPASEGPPLVISGAPVNSKHAGIGLHPVVLRSCFIKGLLSSI